MRVPELYRIRNLLDYAGSVSGSRPNGSWGPIRPLGYPGLCLIRRFKLAYRVFIGELDAVKWED